MPNLLAPVQMLDWRSVAITFYVQNSGQELAGRAPPQLASGF